MNKKATILIENTVFIILNLVFLAIMLLFVFSKTGSASSLEEGYAKKIALIIDAAKPNMVITLYMEDAIKEADKENWKGALVYINDNVVTVKLKEKGGYSYSFFNDVDVGVSRELDGYRFTIT